MQWVWILQLLLLLGCGQANVVANRGVMLTPASDSSGEPTPSGEPAHAPASSTPEPVPEPAAAEPAAEPAGEPVKHAAVEEHSTPTEGATEGGATEGGTFHEEVDPEAAAVKEEELHKMQAEGYHVEEDACGEVHEELSDLDKLWMTTLMVSVLILLSLGIEGAMHCLKHQFARCRIVRLLDIFSKEIMIVGVLSLSIFMEEQFGGLSSIVGIHLLSEERKHLFEYVHIMLLVVILSYIFISTFIMFYAMSLSSYFEWIEEHATECLEEHKVFERRRRELGTCCSWMHLYWRYRWEKVKFRYDYLMLRAQFVGQHDLLGRFEKFRFCDYLRKATRNRGLEFAEVNWRVWLVSLLFVALSAILVKVLQPDMLHAGLIFVILTDLIAFFVIWSWHRSVKIVDELARNYPRYVKGGEKYGPQRAESEGEDGKTAILAEEEESEEKEEHEEHEGEEEEEHFKNPKTPEAKRQARLFPFHNPVVFVDILQLTSLATVMEVALFAAYFYGLAHKERFVLEFFYDLGLLFPPVVALVFVPLILPRVIVATSVAAYWDLESLEAVKKKMEKQEPKPVKPAGGEPAALERVVQAREKFVTQNRSEE